jgi:hypothetical protein
MRLHFTSMLVAVCALLVAAFVYDSSAINVAAALSTASADASLRSYSLTRPDGSQVKAALSSDGTIAVAFISHGQRVAYANKGVDLLRGGAILLAKQDAHSNIEQAPEKVRVTILGLRGTKLRLKVSELSGERFEGVAYVQDDGMELEWEEGVSGYNCQSSTGTGQCNNVNDDAAWWRCFRCCLAIGGCGPFQYP